MGADTVDYNKPAYILTSRYEWDIWYNYIRSEAQARKIWDFIDPDQAVILNKPEDVALQRYRPIPVPSSVSISEETPTEGGPSSNTRAASASRAISTATRSYSQLDQQPEDPNNFFKRRQVPDGLGLNEWVTYVNALSRNDRHDYTELERALSKYIEWFNTTLGPEFQQITAMRSMIRDKLRILVERVQPVKTAITEHIIQRFLQVMERNLNKYNVLEWLSEVLTIYDRLEQNSSILLAGNEPANILAKALSQKYPSIQDDIDREIIRAEKLGQYIDFREIIKDARQQVELQEKRNINNKGKHTAFAVKGKPSLKAAAGPGDNTGTASASALKEPSSELKPCKYCELSHIKKKGAHYKSCWALTPSLAPEKFRLKIRKETKKAAIEKMKQESKEVQAAFKAFQDQQKEDDDDDNNNSTKSKGKEKDKRAYTAEAFSAGSFSNESPTSRACIIVNSGATAHIFNDEKWFLHIDDAIDQHIRGISGTTKVQGVGTVRIVLEDGQIVTFADVLYVPGIFVNILSELLMKKKGLYWNTETDRIYHRQGKKQENIFQIRRIEEKPCILYQAGGNDVPVSEFLTRARNFEEPDE
ncbi:uncharacterized protein UV8b_07200 [Ustilaginoidea virens]|uniref:Retrovirus-related Pol polyprotein from transposon TNT 1-94-like beta-barrel domain-containing protein n=1 Tax=Ustilaginoidea virens TaxID=1159556 RepID=A0A8E5HWN7_USTVR|nr:uncharacterized protein UV8b_07200 [Ustilaginoidea virens]QUC22959.1 hypothetical protein UV8b_07200 [Ustilaginoidea virens]